MTTDTAKILLYPFETGDLAPPPAGTRTLYLGARPGFQLPGGWKAAVDCIQPQRSEHLRLSAEGRTVQAESSGHGYDVALVSCGRHRGENELRLADALRRTRPGALIVVAGGKTDGIASLRKRVAALLPIADHAAKHHGMVFWLERPDAADDAADALEAANPPLMVADGLETRAGLFSHGRIDPGSGFLAETVALSGKLSGSVADFGAGWGYLSLVAARRFADIASIDLFENDHNALVVATRNLAAAGVTPTIAAHWKDLVTEPVPRRFDAILMNPPFHSTRDADLGLAEAMIRTASGALKPGGILWLVANQHLPYERTIEKGFARYEEVARDRGFKVIRAKR